MIHSNCIPQQWLIYYRFSFWTFRGVCAALLMFLLLLAVKSEWEQYSGMTASLLVLRGDDELAGARRKCRKSATERQRDWNNMLSRWCIAEYTIACWSWRLLDVRIRHITQFPAEPLMLFSPYVICVVNLDEWFASRLHIFTSQIRTVELLSLVTLLCFTAR